MTTTRTSETNGRLWGARARDRVDVQEKTGTPPFFKNRHVSLSIYFNNEIGTVQSPIHHL